MPTPCLSLQTRHGSKSHLLSVSYFSFLFVLDSRYSVRNCTQISFFMIKFCAFLIFSDRGGLQSLGKTTVRPPKPVAIPSLRKEHAGHDPTISLVPSGGGGWGTANSSKEKTRSSSPALERPKAEPVASTTSSATSSNQSLNDTPAKRNWAAVSSPEPAGAKKGLYSFSL